MCAGQRFNPTFHDYTDGEHVAHGGRFWDVAVGITYNLPGAWTGSRISLEWVQPAKDDFNGTQLERRGTAYANWQHMF